MGDRAGAQAARYAVDGRVPRPQAREVRSDGRRHRLRRSEEATDLRRDVDAGGRFRVRRRPPERRPARPTVRARVVGLDPEELHRGVRPRLRQDAQGRARSRRRRRHRPDAARHDGLPRRPYRLHVRARSLLAGRAVLAMNPRIVMWSYIAALFVLHGVAAWLAPIATDDWDHLMWAHAHRKMP